MSKSTFAGVDDAPVIALARLILKRARISLPCVTRAHALAIIRGVRPAPSKRAPLGFKPCNPEQASVCRKCGQPIKFDEPCHAFSRAGTDEHITCPLYVRALIQMGGSHGLQ